MLIHHIRKLDLPCRVMKQLHDPTPVPWLFVEIQLSCPRPVYSEKGEDFIASLVTVILKR